MCARCGKIRVATLLVFSHRSKKSVSHNSSTNRPFHRERQSQKTRDRKSKLECKESKWERGREGERWCSESCHWCENSMEGSQTLEAIFTSSANSDRLPSAPLRRISATLSLIHTSLFPHFIPARSRYCSSKYPKQYVILSKLDISELSMMGLKMTSNGCLISYTACPKRVSLWKEWEKVSRSKIWLVFSGGCCRKLLQSFKVYASCWLFVTQAAPKLFKNRAGTRERETSRRSVCGVFSSRISLSNSHCE